MRKTILLVLLVLSLLLPVMVIATPGATDSSTAKLLADVRQVTGKYHNVSVAIADGYTPVGPCVIEDSANPDGPVMGTHYLNFGLASDLAVNELSPEILLYVNTDKNPKLVGVEYFVVNVGQPAPTLFGRPMDGPMPGHEPGQPEHFDLHVWVWHGNPDGIFVAFNPAVRC